MPRNTLSVAEIVRHIEQGKLFEAEPTSGGFIVKINKYVPFCCTAIHNGSRLRPELQQKTLLNDYSRWYEEDPYTGDFISSLPITIIGNDSRYEYDLNRQPELCIYEEAWGQKVWKKKLSTQEKRQSYRKHDEYYTVLHALVSKLESLFGGCVVYDIHSYNYKRLGVNAPLFNIGTERIDISKYSSTIEHWISELNSIQIPDIENRAVANEVFFGRGYTVEYVNNNFKNTLVLATEIKKIYCDELSGDDYPKLLRLLQQKLKNAILNNANEFSSKLEKWHFMSVNKLLDKKLSRTLLKIDKDLFGLLKNFELLATVSPINTNIEKRKFFKNKCTSIPQFKYNPVKINPYELKQKLMSIPLQNIQDISIRNLYESVLSAYFDKIDMIASINTPKFHYNSLRYFGRPSKKDILNAHYLLHLPNIPGQAKKEPIYSVAQAMEVFRSALNDYGIEAKVEVSNKVISQVMVLNSKKKILFQPEAEFKRRELNALIEHEIGVHMVTTINSNAQKLKIFNLGMPVNTQTQEGLAILAEYLSGNLTLSRLKKFALRVILVDMMCSGADFIECYSTLVNDHDVEQVSAFNLVTRIFRGGGFTKDYLYLSGFVKILRMWEKDMDLTPLLIGKTSLPFYNTIEEMIGREMIEKPQYITKSLNTPQTDLNNPIYSYILSGLK